MADLDTLPGPALVRLIDNRDRLLTDLLRAVIAAGHGDRRMSELRTMTGDRLVAEYVEASDALHAARDELSHRQRYHGHDGPINGAHTPSTTA